MPPFITQAIGRWFAFWRAQVGAQRPYCATAIRCRKLGATDLLKLLFWILALVPYPKYSNLQWNRQSLLGAEATPFGWEHSSRRFKRKLPGSRQKFEQIESPEILALRHYFTALGYMLTTAVDLPTLSGQIVCKHSLYRTLNASRKQNLPLALLVVIDSEAIWNIDTYMLLLYDLIGNQWKYHL